MYFGVVVRVTFKYINKLTKCCVRLSAYIILFYFVFVLQTQPMSSTKIILTSQARSVNKCKNLRSKVLKCCVNIYFNRQGLKKNLTSKYVKIQTPRSSPSSTFTKYKTVKLRKYYCVRLCTHIILFYHCTSNTTGCPLPKKGKSYLTGNY